MALKIIIISAIGFLLSAYAYYVENKASQSKNYKAVCDINEKMSCTRAFTSPYGKMFGISNSLTGIFFYFLILILNFYNAINYIFYLAVLSFIGTIYLAYVLYFKVKLLCIVCNAVYLVNILLLIFGYIEIK